MKKVKRLKKKIKLEGNMISKAEEKGERRSSSQLVERKPPELKYIVCGSYTSDSPRPGEAPNI